MRYTVAQPTHRTMAATAPTPAPSAKTSVPAPAVAESAAPMLDPDTEIAQLKARLAQLEPVPNSEDKEPGPVDETVNMSGLVLRKTVDMDGVCETEVLKKPTIDPELIRATKASQRQAGF